MMRTSSLVSMQIQPSLNLLGLPRPLVSLSARHQCCQLPTLTFQKSSTSLRTKTSLLITYPHHTPTLPRQNVERKTNSHKYDPPLVVRLGSGRSKTQKISPSPAASTKPKSCATSGAVGTYPGSPSISVVSRRATPISGAAHESTGKFLDSSPHSSRQTQSLPPAPPSVQNPLPLLVNVSKSSQPPPSSADPVLHNIPVEVDKPSFSYEYEIDGVPVIDTDIVRPNPETGDTEEEEMQVLGELSYPASSDMDNSLDSEDLTKGLEYAAVHGVSNTEGDMEHESRGPGARSTSVQTSADLEKTPDAGDATKAPREGDRSKLDGKAELEQRAIDFLHQYIRTWEYDRAGLSRAYAANAVFTCSVVLPPSSSLSPAVSPTQAFASHFVTSISAFIPSSLSSTSSRLLQRPPVPIQTPAIISPALLLLDPQRLFTFFPHGEQAQLAYEALYLGDFDSSLPLPANQYVQLYGQVEMRRRLAKSAQTMKGKERARANEDEETLSITWTFLLRADASKKMSGEDNEFPMQIMTHQMEVRDGQ
ncbi:hypothetical protein GYMLUDRAFT_729344 [Collybiopsis luxurians FD-317 M1]|nr:hypothetical protein GYMLUDRAFT_729344 [Collybiopsis luxurians FD-317 M1]